MKCFPKTTASIYGDYILETGSAPNLNMFDIVNKQNNPADNYDTQTLLDISSGLAAVLPVTNTSAYPYTDSRYKQGPILFPEIADFLNETGLNAEQVSETLKDYRASIPEDINGVMPNTPKDVDILLKQLEFYYADNLGLTIAGGLCSASINPFGKLGDLLSKITLAGQLLGALLDFNLADILGPFTALKAKLEKIVDELAETLKAQVDGIVKSAQSFVKNVKAGAKKIKKKLQKMVSNIKNFFSGDSVTGLKDKIGEFVSKAVDQFEEITPAVIGLLMFRFCQFTEMLQLFMLSPVNVLKDFMSKLKTEETVVRDVAQVRTQDAVNAGAVRIDEKGIQEGKARIVKAQNEPSIERDSKPTELPVDLPEPEHYVASDDLTDAENEALSALGPSGMDGYLKFAPSVINMGKSVSDAGPNAGFSEIRTEVMQKLVIVARRMGKTLTINSGYRSPEYNERIGGAKNSQHKSGLAVDISMAGFSDDDIRNFIRIASQEGFLGIAYYTGGNFTHLDIGSRRTWERGHRFDNYLAMHLQDGFRKGKAAPVPPVEEPALPEGIIAGRRGYIVKATDPTGMEEITVVASYASLDQAIAVKDALENGKGYSYTYNDAISGRRGRFTVDELGNAERQLI